MKSWLLAAAVLVAGSMARGGLEEDVRAIVGDKSMGKAQVGVCVASLDKVGGKIVVSQHGETPLMPASNMKVCTTSAALDAFGADFKYKTVLLTHNGDAVVVADGDPSLGDAEILRPIGWTSTTTFEKWAAELKKRGVNSVHDVVIDDSIFDQSFFPASWPVAQSNAAYEAEVGGLTLNAGMAGFLVKPTTPGKLVSYSLVPPTDYFQVINECKTGDGQVWLHRDPAGNEISIKGATRVAHAEAYQVTVHDPGMYAGSVFAEVLKEQGINVTGKVVRDLTVRSRIAASSGQWQAVAIHQTPIATVMARCNKDSMNVYAESLCKRLGYAATGQAGSWKNGTAAVGAFLQKTGADPKQFHLEDGCGLSREDRVSPETLVHVLMYDFKSKNRDAFISSLAVGGVDGTLDRRFKTDLKGRVFAKTGYISGVSSLSGFVKVQDDQWYAFSILMNGVSPGVGKPAQEKIVAAIDKWAKKG